MFIEAILAYGKALTIEWLLWSLIVEYHLELFNDSDTLNLKKRINLESRSRIPDDTANVQEGGKHQWQVPSETKKMRVKGKLATKSHHLLNKLFLTYKEEDAFPMEATLTIFLVQRIFLLIFDPEKPICFKCKEKINYLCNIRKKNQSFSAEENIARKFYYKMEKKCSTFQH